VAEVCIVYESSVRSVVLRTDLIDAFCPWIIIIVIVTYLMIIVRVKLGRRVLSGVGVGFSFICTPIFFTCCLP
jgi:uncharacterized membrane protein